MIHFFPEIYPDELWYSVLCRYHIRCGNYKNLTTIGCLFRNKIHAGMGSFFPNKSITDIVDQLPDGTFNMEDIILNHTLFKFFFRMQSTDKKVEYLADLRKGCAVTPTNIWKNSYRDLPELKFCPMCKNEDEKEYGESYWHLGHQIPIIQQCMKHGCKLITYNCTRKGQLNECFILPDDYRGVIREINCSSGMNCFLTEVLTDYLYLPLEAGPTDGYNNLFQALNNAGYGKIGRYGDSYIDSEKIYPALVEVCGKDIIKKVFGKTHRSYTYLRLKKWQIANPEKYALLAVLANQPACITFGKEVVFSGIEEKILELYKKNICYSKKQLRQELGLSNHQLESLTKKLGLLPFWDCTEKIDDSDDLQRSSVKFFVTEKEKEEIVCYAKENKYANTSEFIKYCVRKEMNSVTSIGKEH